jgi:hypothetical protein
MIAASGLLSLAGLCGWTIGLTLHARARARWQDSGARLAWALAAATIVVITAIGAATIALLSGSAIALPAIGAALMLGARAGWSGSQRISTNRRDACSSRPAETARGLSVAITVARRASAAAAALARRWLARALTTSTRRGRVSGSAARQQRASTHSEAPGKN